MNDTTKTGPRTSEFWVTLVAGLLIGVNDALGLGLPQDTVLTLAGLAASYILSRTAVKLGGAREAPAPQRRRRRS